MNGSVVIALEELRIGIVKSIKWLVAFSVVVSQSAAVAVADERVDEIKLKLSAVVAPQNILGVTESPMPGLMEVQLRGGKLLYTSEDGEFVIDGSLYQMANGRAINIQQQRINELMQPKRVSAIESLTEDDLVTFKAKGETKATIYAFTDVDCGYCRKLHREMASYNEKGIEVRYLAYPRAGVGSGSYKKLVSIWCSDNPLQAMTMAKAGKPIESKTCSNPVAKQYAMGGEVGVTGTPSLMTVDGRLLPGYMPADRLANALGIN